MEFQRTTPALILVALLSAAPTLAQDSSTVLADSLKRGTEAPYRNPRKAAMLGSLFPGAGHIYAGEYLHGYATYVVTMSSVVIGVITISDRCTIGFLAGKDCPEPRWRSDLKGAAWIGLGGWVWVLTARDAPRAAERANERHRRSASVEPLIRFQPLQREQLLVGGQLRW